MNGNAGMKTKKTGRTIKVRIDNLDINLFVRESLDHDHAIKIALMMENGVKFQPIQITEGLVVVDGRHRIEAHKINNQTDIWAEVVTVEGETDLIRRAYLANVGGALPPTVADTEHTIRLLLERQVPKKQIGELLSMPPDLAKRYVDNVQSRLNRAKLMRAVEAVTQGGLNVPQAAENHGVDQKKLRDFLSGNKRKQKVNAIEEVKKGLTRSHQSLSLRNANVFRTLLKKVQDGDISFKQAEDVFEHVDHMRKSAERALNDWKSRFRALTAPDNENPIVKNKTA